MKVSHYFFLLAAVYGARFVGEKLAASIVAVSSLAGVIYAVKEVL